MALPAADFSCRVWFTSGLPNAHTHSFESPRTGLVGFSRRVLLQVRPRLVRCDGVMGGRERRYRQCRYHLFLQMPFFSEHAHGPTSHTDPFSLSLPDPRHKHTQGLGTPSPRGASTALYDWRARDTHGRAGKQREQPQGGGDKQKEHQQHTSSSKSRQIILVHAPHPAYTGTGGGNSRHKTNWTDGTRSSAGGRRGVK